ncbi:MAG: penicillin acylase family protein, partial [Bacteroidia bacterium]|nr:penicillin acylase family protein [Bacteroidia bacterium]MDW8134321.1 penicillin acylase family protein [Bacteroidia bacterium]
MRVENIIRLLGLGAAILTVEVGLGRRWGNIPPLGRFFSPYEGFWRNAESPSHTPPKYIHISSLQDSVIVIWDKRWVPHIYARTEADLYRVQGYLQGYLRLWQMEIQSYFIAGQLSRILGKDFIEHDRAMRRLGVLHATEKASAIAQNDSLIWSILNAFSEGVNAYIDQLKPPDYPLEYKLLNFSP